MAEKVLIYAGTTEGRLLAQELSRAHIACDVHVATEYGQMVMPELAGVKVCVGRLDVEEMRALLKKNGQNNYAAVVDATHPFATEVSANIRESTKGSGTPYLRLQRRMDDGICSSYRKTKVYTLPIQVSSFLFEEVEGDHAEFQTGTTAQEQYRIPFRDIE